MNEQGLAQIGGIGKEQEQQLVMEVVGMLQQGATPEQLLQAGIPEDVLEAAIEMFNGQVNQPQGMQLAMQPEAGLASMNSSNVEQQ
jgi:hypothetical protein